MLPQKQAEEAIVNSNFTETENNEGGGNNMVREDDNNEQENSMFTLKSFLWHGGSVWDAWFSCASNQVYILTFFFNSYFSFDIFLNHPIS